MKKIIAFTGLLLVFTLGFFSLPWADDFCTMFLRSTHTPLSYAIHFYENRDGRFLTFFMQSLLSFNVLISRISVQIWISFFYLLSYFVLLIVIPQKKSRNVWSFFILTAIFWIGFRRHISETVYWSTGGGYVFAAWLGLTWIFFYDKIRIDNRKKILGWSVFSFIAGITSFSLSPALLTYAIYDRLYSYYLNRDKNTFKDFKFILSVTMVLLGTIIMVSAPGNFIRAEDPHEAFQGFILWNLVLVNLKFISFGWPLIGLCAFFAYLFRNEIFEINSSKRWQWFLTAISTASPFALLNGFTSPRTAIFFHVFFSIFLISCFKLIFDKMREHINIKKFIVISFLSFFFIQIFKDHYEAYKYANEYSAQLDEMESNRGSRKKLFFSKQYFEPRSLRVKGFSNKADYFSNDCAAIYYDVESIQYTE